MQLLACLVSVDSLLLCITFQPLQNITNLSWQNATKAALEPLDAMSIVFPAAAQSFFSDVVKYWDYRDYFDWGRKSQRKSHERTQRQGVGWMSLVSSSPWPHLTRQGHQQDEAARYQQRSAGGQHPRCYWTAALISNPSKWFQMYQWDFPWGHPGRDGCIASRPCWKCQGMEMFFSFFFPMPIAITLQCRLPRNRNWRQAETWTWMSLALHRCSGLFFDCLLDVFGWFFWCNLGSVISLE